MATFGKREIDRTVPQRKPSLVERFSAMEPKDKRTIGTLACLPLLFILLLIAPLIYTPPTAAERAAAARQHQAEKAAAAAERLAAKIEQRAASCIADEEDMARMAYVYLQTVVKSRLKSPSSAEFPYPMTIGHIGDCRFRIAGYVDAQNGFGAMLRTPYNGTMIYNAVSDDWSLGSLSL